MIEIPAGGFERGEEGLEVAKRELLEETGYISDDWQFIGRTVEVLRSLQTICTYTLQIIAVRSVGSIWTRQKKSRYWSCR